MSGEPMESNEYFNIIKDITKHKSLNISSKELDLGIEWV